MPDPGLRRFEVAFLIGPCSWEDAEELLMELTGVVAGRLGAAGSMSQWDEPNGIPHSADAEYQAWQFLLPTTAEITGVLADGWVEHESLKAKETIMRLLGWDTDPPRKGTRAALAEEPRA